MAGLHRYCMTGPHRYCWALSDIATQVLCMVGLHRYCEGFHNRTTQALLELPSETAQAPIQLA